jgi:acyl-CoA synthetase (AMP-forming)/AMP-acid ligase II
LKPSTLIELLRRRAHSQPERRAYTFLSDGESAGPSLTYAELERQARAIGALLQSCVASGERALLLYPPGLEFISAFFGSVYSGIIAVPAPLPRNNKTLNHRLAAIVNDAQPTTVLTTSQILATLEKLYRPAPHLQSIRWLSTDDVSAERAGEWRDPGARGDSLVLLQYTSGSTATPKGVMVSHQNVLHNCAELDIGCEHTPESVSVTWLPHFHDMGLIYGLMQPLHNGFPCYILPPMYFLQRPLRWLQAMSSYRATHCTAPNFAYDLCVSKIKPEQRATLDLSHWRVAGVGAEPVRKRTLDRFIEAFAPSGFRAKTFCPAYGLAETTLMVSASHAKELPLFDTFEVAALEQGRVIKATEENGNAQTLVGCGRPAPGTQVVIVRPETSTRCAHGEVGEVWVSSASVAQGYWNRPEETEQAFRAYLSESLEGPFFRTGDLGFFHDGELFITGRLKDLIIIAGRNLYPQDIERTVEECHPALRPTACAAFSVEVDGQEQLVVLAEVEPRYKQAGGSQDLKSDRHPLIEGESLLREIRKAVAEEHDAYAYAVMLLKAGSLPKTSSGKVQRHACRNSFQAGSLEVWNGSR